MHVAPCHATGSSEFHGLPQIPAQYAEHDTAPLLPDAFRVARLKLREVVADAVPLRDRVMVTARERVIDPLRDGDTLPERERVTVAPPRDRDKLSERERVTVALRDDEGVVLAALDGKALAHAVSENDCSCV